MKKPIAKPPTPRRAPRAPARVLAPDELEQVSGGDKVWSDDWLAPV